MNSVALCQLPGSILLSNIRPQVLIAPVVFPGHGNGMVLDPLGVDQRSIRTAVVCQQCVEIIYPARAQGTAAALLGADVRWEGDPAELDRLLGEVQQMRAEDLRLELDRPEGSLR